MIYRYIALLWEPVGKISQSPLRGAIWRRQVAALQIAPLSGLCDIFPTGSQRRAMYL